MNRLVKINLSAKNKIGRVVWNIVWGVFGRTSPKLFHPWRSMLLRLFGAKVGVEVHVYPTAKIWAPWNLEIDDRGCIGESVDCYCVDKIRIGAGSTVSQYSFLCSASHDFTDVNLPLVAAPITIGDYVWVTADVFVAPGVEIKDRAVVLARSSVFNDVESGVVVKGNPAKYLRERDLTVKSFR